jgi:predicted methyltransferase
MNYILALLMLLPVAPIQKSVPCRQCQGSGIVWQEWCVCGCCSDGEYERCWWCKGRGVTVTEFGGVGRDAR